MTYTDDAHLFSQYDLNAIISLLTFPQTTYIIMQFLNASDILWLYDQTYNMTLFGLIFERKLVICLKHRAYSKFMQ